MTGLIVAGMHRSGTSLTTRLLSAGGWHPGDDLLSSETEQYEENAAFVALHRAWLNECLPAGDGHRDWGISEGGGVDLASVPSPRSEAMTADAASFVLQRDREAERWVAKDPRATLFLPVWAQIEQLRFVLVYRNPWDVVDSAVRLGADVFCRRPRLALAAWLDHNRRLTEFATAHRDRCVVVASERLTLDPHEAWEVLNRTFGLEGNVPDDLVNSKRYVRRDDDHPIAGLYRDVHPGVCAVLDELDRLADLPRAEVTRATEPARCAVPGGSLPAGTGVQVITACRDDGDFLLEAVASVDFCARRAHARAGRDQVELTVVDDGSTDPDTLVILEALRKAGRHVISTPPAGLAAARNTALASSRTRAVIALDADNRLCPALVDAVDDIERGTADVVHGPWQRFGLDRDRIDPPMMTLDSLVPGNSIDACALVSRSLLERLGGWDPSLPFWEDWDLWLGAVGSGAAVRRVNEVTFEYLVRPGAMSTVAPGDPAVRERVVKTITTKHASLFGASLARLVTMFHHFDAFHAASEESRGRLEQAYKELEAHHHKMDAAYRTLETEYRSLETAYRTLETEYRSLETAYRALETAYRALEAEYLALRDGS